MKRRFILGSEWIYCKVYAGEKTADRILLELLYPQIIAMKKAGEIDKFFFVRYSDESGFHLRIRLHIIDNNKYYSILSRIHNVLRTPVENRTITKVTYDTYVREFERYGSEMYPITEDFFCADSASQLEILVFIQKNGNNDLRWKVALIMMNDLLDMAGYHKEKRLGFLATNRDRYREEFYCNNKFYIHNHNSIYRKNKLIIESALSRELPEKLVTIIEQRNNNLLLVLSNERHLQQFKEPLYLASIIHMSINRLFESSSRLYEMALYEYLFNYTRSSIARAAQSKKLNIHSNY